MRGRNELSPSRENEAMERISYLVATLQRSGSAPTRQKREMDRSNLKEFNFCVSCSENFMSIKIFYDVCI